MNLFYEFFSEDKAYSNTFIEGACSCTVFERSLHQTVMCILLPTASQVTGKNKNFNGL